MKIIKNILLILAVAVLFATGATLISSNANASSGQSIFNHPNSPVARYAKAHSHDVGKDIGGTNVNGLPFDNGDKEASFEYNKNGKTYLYDDQGVLESVTPENSNSSNSTNSNASHANSANSNSQNSQYQNSNTNNNKLVQTNENKKNTEAIIAGAVLFLAVIGFAWAQHIHMTHVI